MCVSVSLLQVLDSEKKVFVSQYLPHEDGLKQKNELLFKDIHVEEKGINIQKSLIEVSGIQRHHNRFAFLLDFS